ncbi:hypothetical protein Aglo01_63570 [Actinokineospora globicatena]|nr:hypothetical protein Aglo01_63570 [Actinokineospora globicatena]GLW88670.1 hypothetical protein Aglo02_63090 [Actinokineospora globicatena]
MTCGGLPGPPCAEGAPTAPLHVLALRTPRGRKSLTKHPRARRDPDNGNGPASASTTHSEHSRRDERPRGRGARGGSGACPRPYVSTVESTHGHAVISPRHGLDQHGALGTLVSRCLAVRDRAGRDLGGSGLGRDKGEAAAVSWWATAAASAQ